MDPMEERTPPGRSRISPPPAQLPQPGSAPSANNLPPAPRGSISGSSVGVAPAGSKRKRGLGVVTLNACTECRKKRAKCDGHKPCGRCKAQKDVECIYELPVRQSKENLRHEIERLRRQQRKNEQVIAALGRPDVWEEVLSRLRRGQSVESISEWLGGTLPPGGGALPSINHLLNQASVALPPAVSRYAPAAPTSYSPTPPGPSTLSPVSAQQPPGIRHEADQQSPWGGGHFATQSHTTPTASHPDTMTWNPDVIKNSQSRVGSWVQSQVDDSEASRGRGFGHILSSDVPEMQVPPGTWTKLTSDAGLVQHLLSLYFCWEYPTFASLSKEHFLEDFMQGRPRFCSSILVNALLALGCRFSNQPNTRSVPDDPHTSGNHFFKECQRLYYQEQNHHKLTTIQALGIMSIREASCGRDSESWYYAGQSIRLAIEMGLHRIQEDSRDDDESAVQAATFWGAFALDHAWSLATGSLPQSSCFPQLPPKPAIIDDIEASLWIAYTDDGKDHPLLLSRSLGAPLQRSCEQPSNVRSVYKCFAELSELVHQSLYILHSPGRPLTSRDLLTIYTQYLNWYDKIPEVLRLGHNFTPAVLFAHMYYHFAILSLFRPLIKLRILGSSITPRDVCSQAADAITGLTRSYAQLYTLRRTPSFVPYFVLTASIMHLAIAATGPSSRARESGGDGQGGQDGQSLRILPKLDPHISDVLGRGIADLTEMAPCHHFAEQALNILRFLAKKWDIDVEIRATAGAEARLVALPSVDQATRPVTNSLNFFSPNFMESDFTSAWGGGGGGGGGTSSGAGADTKVSSTRPDGGAAEMAEALENPLFWPFPMQGRPMLPVGRDLEEAGFELI
ncbi:fungal-specific transcription factor domain-containing protein [Chaetomidium leptoderma]|uniref:Fungal-specific transcription factor domain-containing protein n=1 Tax=Chaetomidium leptoderma TaxID=669021 RepID=A0AAN7A1G8_9PEZI|nr:fungal-specific transcription factor domain-containing protein [Chaetomidium leptoderma]